MARYWLMKSEPSVFSFEDLVRSPGRTTHWEGVRNYQARNLMRDEFKLGDRAFFYHSNTDEPSVVGVMEIVQPGYPDDSALDPKSHYYDERTKNNSVSPWVRVDVKAVQRMHTPVSRAMLAGHSATRSMMVLRRGARLSVQPVTQPEFDAVCRLGKPGDL